MLHHGDNLFMNCQIHSFNNTILLWTIGGRDLLSDVTLSAKIDELVRFEFFTIIRLQAFNFQPNWFSTIASHFEKNEDIQSFVLARYAHTFLVASLMNVTKYIVPPRDLCSIEQQTFEWTKSSILNSLGSLVI